MTSTRFLPSELSDISNMIAQEQSKKAAKLIILSADRNRANASRWAMLDDIAERSPEAAIHSCYCDNVFTAVRLIQDQTCSTVLAMPLSSARSVQLHLEKAEASALLLISTDNEVRVTVIKQGLVVSSGWKPSSLWSSIFHNTPPLQQDASAFDAAFNQSVPQDTSSRETTTQIITTQVIPGL